MEFFISRTEDGVVRYPMHRHPFCEIMLYLEGNGALKTEGGDIPFEENTAIIVPKNIAHGSVSENGFRNISIGGHFENLLLFDTPVPIKATIESRTLAKLVYENQYADNTHLLLLVNCYISSLMQSFHSPSHMDTVINGIVNDIAQNALRTEYAVTSVLNSSGYAEDYIREKFRMRTGKTPVGFVHQVRINHACMLLEIYGKEISLAEISEKCGFANPIYFSRIFKRIKQVSPSEYIKRLNNTEAPKSLPLVRNSRLSEIG